MAEHRQPDADGVSAGAYAEAYRHLCKAAGEAEVSYAMRGRLYLSKSGWLLLSVPNALARGVFDTIHEPGVELPADDEGRLNAHVSVMTPSEVSQIGGADRISERGHMVAWTLGPLRTCVPDGWKGVSRVWFCEVRSPELEKIRKSYGLSPTPKYPFHLTVAVRKTSVLRHNDVKKADAPDRLPGGEADGEPDSAFPPEALAEGARHEREHTTDPALAREIAKDHLRGEGADYYEKLEAMEEGGEKAAGRAAAPGEPSSEIRGGSTDGKRAAVTYVPRAVLDAVRAEGLLSGERIAGRPELLERLAAARKADDPAAFAAEFKRTVADKVKGGWDSPRGPNVLFKPPPASTTLPDNHPLRQWDLVPVRVKLERLLRDVPGTRVHGQELTPYSKAEDEKDPEYHKRRHHDLDAGELRRLARASAARLWATYADPDGKGMYAPNVPHAAVVTPDGRIDPKYLTFPKDAAADPLAEYLGDPDPEEFDMAAVKRAAAGYRFEGDVQGVGLRKHLHDQLDRHGLPGVAYNDARTGDALAVLGGPEAKRRAAVKDLTDRLDAIGADYRVTPTEVRQRLRRVLVDAAAADRFVDRQGFSMLKERGTPAALQWLADRYRLRPNAEGVLEGRLPPPAVRQIRGLDPVYAYQLDADEWAKRYGGQNRPYWAGRKPWRDAPAAVKAAGVPMLAKRKKKDPKEDLRRPGVLPWLVLGAGAGSLAGSRAIASDAQLREVGEAIDEMSRPLAPNRTHFTQYAATLAPAAGLTPFGIPAYKIMPAIRSSRLIMGVDPASVLLRGDPNKAKAWEASMKEVWPAFDPKDNPYLGASLFKIPYGKYLADLVDRKSLRGQPPEGAPLARFMGGRVGNWLADKLDATGIGDFLDKGVNIPEKHLGNPWRTRGLQAGHYKSFADGPVAAYAHMLEGQWAAAPVGDAALLPGGRPMTHAEYFYPKLREFIAKRTQDSLYPNEFNRTVLPVKEQSKLLEEWMASLTPREQAELKRLESSRLNEFMGSNVPTYSKAVSAVKALKQKLHTVGVTAGGAGLGGLLGHRLYRWLFPEKADDSASEHDWAGGAAVGAGMGLGGAAGYLAGTEDGRQRVAAAVEALRAKLFPTLLKKEGWVGAAAKAVLPALKWLGAGAGLGAGAAATGYGAFHYGLPHVQRRAELAATDSAARTLEAFGPNADPDASAAGSPNQAAAAARFATARDKAVKHQLDQTLAVARPRIQEEIDAAVEKLRDDIGFDPLWFKKPLSWGGLPALGAMTGMAVSGRKRRGRGGVLGALTGAGAIGGMNLAHAYAPSEFRAAPLIGGLVGGLGANLLGQAVMPDGED